MKTVIKKSSELKEMIKINYKLGIPTLILGPIGVGKSEIVKQLHYEIFKGKKNVFVDLRASQLERSDLMGLFKIEGGVTQWCPPQQLINLIENGGTLFFDEINLAPDDVQGALYKLILDREINGTNLKFGDNVLIVAAGNTNQEVNIVNNISPALINRFSVLYYEPENAGIIQYLNEKYPNEFIVHYLMNKPNLLIEKINDSDDMVQFARPRGWERVIRFIREFNVTVTELINNNLYKTVIASYVGEKCANELYSDLIIFEKINLEKYLNNPEELKQLKPLEKILVLLKLNNEIINKKIQIVKSNNEVLEKVFTLLSLVPKEMLIIFLQSLKNANIELFEKFIDAGFKNKTISKVFSNLYNTIIKFSK